jgi:cytoskeleton protein RodZ
MTENTQVDSSPAAATAGGLLKAARQAVGMHLAVLSVNLKVPVRQLEALEADQYLLDQSPVFARGLAASVCRQLRIDPAPVLALMPLSSNYLEPNGAMRQAYTVPSDLGRLPPVSLVAPSKTWGMALGLLLLIAALIWLPNVSQWAWFENLRASWSVSEPAAQAAAPVALAESTTLGGAGVVLSTSEPVPQKVPETTPVLAMGVGSTGAMGAAASGSPSAAPSPSSSATLLPSAPNPSVLVFSAQNMSWIEVRDTQKQLVWNGVLNAGETKSLTVPLPVSVVVGRSDVIQLSVKGQPFDLKPHTQVNTARFEVKP